jgi:pimeloyl-ACP methyl ester carboxylesterase
MRLHRRDWLKALPALAAGGSAWLGSWNEGLLAQGREGESGVQKEIVNYWAEDKAPSFGIYYRPTGKNPKTALIITHPRANSTQHFLAARLAAGGYGVLGQAPRWLNNETNAIQEETLLDVAAGMQFLKQNFQVERFVSIGHSGGGGLFAFYQVQATTDPPSRFSATPAGDPPDLNQFHLPPFAAYVSLAAHKGEGRNVLAWLDPSVVDETDPLTTEWTLDMYDARNGYQKPPESSKYSPEFVARYREAQRARAQRLDAKAYAIIDRQQRARAQMKAADFQRLDATAQMAIRRAAEMDEYMIIYRTAADPLMADLSLDPSDRKVGIFALRDPELGNYAEGGIGRVMTARGFLSTRSGLSTRMLLDENLAKITVPTLVIGATADNSVPGLGTIRTSYEACAAKDKTLVWVKGADHGFTPVEPIAGGRDTQAEAARVVLDWLRPRFPA